MNENYKISYYRIRSAVGLLGISLPFLLMIVNGGVLDSISIYYYSKVSFIFTSILFAFGLFLITYKGYNKEKDEFISDNLLTNTAGAFAILVIIFPTECTNVGLCNPCNEELYNHFLFHYSSPAISTIHLISAGLFLIMMGGMSFFKFARGGAPKMKWFYKICGIIVWASLLIIGISFIPALNIHMKNLTFTFETIALVAFGISWIVKGKLFNTIN